VIRKTVLALSLLVMALGTVVVSSAAANASVGPRKTTAVTFTGKITCKIVSKGSTITVKPGLLLTAKRPHGETFTTTINLAKCTGKTSEGGSTILSGKVSGKGTANTTCVGLLTPPLPTTKGTIVWKTKGLPAASTTFTLSKGSLDSTTGVETYSSKQKGSFSGKGSVSAKVKQSTTQLETACESSKGLTTINLASGKVVAG
jgi:hypothetical protein